MTGAGAYAARIACGPACDSRPLCYAHAVISGFSLCALGRCRTPALQSS